MDVNMMVAIDVAIAILTARSAVTPTDERMRVMNGPISMPPPIPSRPAKKPVARPRAANSKIRIGSSIKWVLEVSARTTRTLSSGKCHI